MTENVQIDCIKKEESELTDSEKRIVELYSNANIQQKYLNKYQEDKLGLNKDLELSVLDISKELKITIQWLYHILARLEDPKHIIKDRYYKSTNYRGFYVYSLNK